VIQIIVCDTGPLLHLHEADALPLLKPAGKIMIPPVVIAELKRNASKWKLPDWVTIQPLGPAASARAAKWIRSQMIDPGEAEAVSLALQVKSDWFLTDDARARQFAESLGVETHGSIGVLLWAVAVGTVENRRKAHQLLDGLVNSSLWISERVVQEASKAIDAMMPE
jgi:predicted nucleic acid-binding protein